MKGNHQEPKWRGGTRVRSRHLGAIRLKELESKKAKNQEKIEDTNSDKSRFTREVEGPSSGF